MNEEKMPAEYIRLQYLLAKKNVLHMRHNNDF
jgi:hypothetical protein